MRYIIYGAGAIGGVVGGKLFASGRDTVLICRGAHLDAIRERGLSLREPDKELELRIPAVGHPSELRFTDEDVVVLTMKTQDTAAALDDLEAAGGDDAMIVCCQNGVENERLAARRFARVYGMVVVLPATFLDPGIVLGWGTPVAGLLDSGVYPSGTDAAIERVAADLSAAGFICRADPAVMRLKYAKLLQNLGNALQVTTGTGRGDDQRAYIMRMLRDEALACYAAAGIVSADAEEYRRVAGGHVGIAEANRAGDKRSGSSTWQSLVRGHRHLETDYLNGEIVLLGRLHGVATPYNAAIRRLAQQLAAEGGQAGSYSPDDIEALAQDFNRKSALTVSAD